MSLYLSWEVFVELRCYDGHLICQLRIYFAIWKNTFDCLDKYILQFGLELKGVCRVEVL